MNESEQPNRRRNPIYRVLHVIPDLEIAGAGRYLLTLLDALPGVEGRWKVGVVCPDWGRLAEALRVRRVPVFPLAEPDRSWSMGNVQSVRQAVRRFRPHLVHTHASLSGRLATALAYPRPRILVTRHGHRQARYENLDARLPGTVKQLGHRVAGTFLADGVIAISHDVGRELKAEGVPDDRIHVIHNGIDVAQFTAPPPSTRLLQDWARWDLDGCQVIALIGRLSPEKGHRYLLEAMAHLRPHRPLLRCLLVGDGPEQPSLAERADKLGISDVVIFTGWRDDVPAMLQRVTLVAVPSLVEGISLALMEALAARRPVVASRVGGIPEVVRHGEEALLVEPGNVPALTAALEGLLAEPEFARQLADNGHQRVSSAFSAEAMTSKTFALARELIQNAQATGEHRGAGSGQQEPAAPEPPASPPSGGKGDA